MSAWFLELRAGARVGLGRGVTTIGRSASCDIVIPDRGVSRRHVLVCARADAVEVVNVGKHAVFIDDEPVEELGRARDGQRVAIAGAVVATVRRAATRPDASSRARWFLRIDGGPLVAIGGERFTVGGGERDDLVMRDWDERALVLHPVDDGVVVEAARPPDERFDHDGFARLGAGESLRYAGARVELLARGGELERSTQQLAGARTVVRLEAFRAGGMLVIETAGDASSLYLPRRRYALLRALLTPAAAGERGYLRVDALCRAIWPDDPVKDETDFNVLLHRVRRDLLRAGVDASALIERARGSGMIRAPIAARPDVELQL